MSATDQILAAFVIGLCLAIVSLCWSLQQAHHRLDDLELEVYPDDDQEGEQPCTHAHQANAGYASPAGSSPEIVASAGSADTQAQTPQTTSSHGSNDPTSHGTCTTSKQHTAGDAPSQQTATNAKATTHEATRQHQPTPPTPADGDTA